ncbi:MAG: hypothetical protein ACJ8LN_05200 [Sulfurifustis sp.]
MKRNRWSAWTLAAVLVACTPATPPPAKPTERATALYFLENDNTAGAATVRMLVTEKFLRIDAGADDGEFILYDRARRTIYNISAADRLILVIPSRAVPVSGAPRLYYRTKRDSAAFPRIEGRPVVHYRLLTNGRVCYDLYAADGLLPEAVAALREYREALAGEQYAAIGYTPNEFKAPCDLANHVYAPARYLVHGFPVRLVELDARDARRRRVTELTDYRTNMEVAPALFDLPASFRRIPLRELQTR